jgi:hypothetical protein
MNLNKVMDKRVFLQERDFERTELTVKSSVLTVNRSEVLPFVGTENKQLFTLLVFAPGI